MKPYSDTPALAFCAHDERVEVDSYTVGNRVVVATQCQQCGRVFGQRDAGPVVL